MRQVIRGFVHGAITALVLLACVSAFAAADPDDQCVNLDPTDACNGVARDTCFFEWELDTMTVDLMKHQDHDDGQISCTFTCFVAGFPVPEAGSCTVGGGLWPFPPYGCHVGFLDCNECPEEPVCIAVCALNPLLPWC